MIVILAVLWFSAFSVLMAVVIYAISEYLHRCELATPTPTPAA